MKKFLLAEIQTSHGKLPIEYYLSFLKEHDADSKLNLILLFLLLGMLKYIY